MGFAELFASPLGQAARAKAALNRGLSGWLDATLTTVRSAAPEVQAFAYSALWAEIDSVKELVPVTPAMLLDQLRADLTCPQVRGQKCTPASTSRFCSCGGLPLPGEIRWEDELTPFEDCPLGRNLCRGGIRCRRHHGPGETLERVQVYVEAPKCPHCQGSGIIPRSEPYAQIRSVFEKQAHFKALRPSNPLHEWILEEGAERTFARRRQNWIWTSRSETGTDDEDPCDASTWMAAAQILFDDEDAQVYYPGTTYKFLKGGSKGYDDWCRLPPSREMCNRLFDFWHRKHTPEYSAEDTLGDFPKQRMGTCYLPIAKSSRIVSREWYGKVPQGSFTHFGECCSGLRSSLEEFLDVFYDCAAQFDGEIELSLNANDKAYRAHGQLGGVQFLLTTPAVCSPAKLLPEIGESDFVQLEDETLIIESQIPPLFRDNGLSALYANLVLKQAFVEPTLMAYPDQEEVEDQGDHLENKEEPIRMPSFDLEPVPRIQPIVRTSTGEGKQPLLNKSRSMRIQSFSSFKGGNIPVGRRVDNTTEAISYELGRASTSNLNPRLDACNLRANGDFAFSQRITYPAAATVGAVIGTLDIFTLITTTNSRVCAEWLEKGYVDRNILMISHLSTSPYLGMAIWYVFDAYGHIPADVTTTVELESIRHLSPHVHILKDNTTSTWILNFHREGGQSLNFAGPGFMKPKVWIIAASSAQMPCSADVQYVVEGYAIGESFVRGLATEKVLTYPVESTHLADLDLLLAPQQLAIGTTATTNFPLSFAEKSITSTKRETYSYAAGLLSHFLGIGGKLRFAVHSTSSCFVTCKLRVFLWGTQPTTVQTAQIPHVDIEGAGTGELLIQSAFYTTANFGDSGARFWIMPLSAPAAPQTVETKFEFYIRILGIDVVPDLCRQINYKQRFGWFMISPSDTTTAELDFKIPSRIGNISVKNTKCVNFTNAFAIMCAATGMHWGRCILHFTWSWHRNTEAGKMKGDFAIQTGMGNSVTMLGDTRVFSIYDNAYSIPFEFGSFAGPVISGGIPNEAENWVRVYSTSWQWIHAVTVSIEVLPGFRFYGRSAGPMTIPS